MTDPSNRFLECIEELQRITASVTPEEAREDFDPATLQIFWSEWPRLGSWAGALWRVLNQDLAEPAEAFTDPETDEVGGGD